MNNPLTDAIPAAARKYLYALMFVAGLALASYQAADGDWKDAALPFVGALVSALAASNTNATPADERGEVGAGLLIAVATLLGVVLLLFGVKFR